VHFALERLFGKMKTALNNVFPSREEFIADFEWHMNRHRESFTKEQFNRRKESGQIILGNYYDKYIHTFNRVVVIEHSIRNVVVNNVPIKGKLDKLEFDGKSVNVVDYKTGDPDKAIKRMKGPNDKDPIGGDYWRQAVFYKILVDNYAQKDWKAVSTEFDFIEPDKKKNYRKEKVVIGPGDIEALLKQITETWAHIQNRDFYTGCGKEDCHWCNFVKTNDLAIALHDTSDEDDPGQPGAAAEL
jgi:DNA helicase-2/ATP-dependent DNA helicase PcrA